ncbi:hypothetical protein pb186bvf_003412 [Paramecium bursaria]
MKLTKDFFMNIIQQENLFLSAKEYSFKQIDKLVNMYSMCVEHYDQQQDPIKFYFIDKIQQTLAHDKILREFAKQKIDLPMPLPSPVSNTSTNNYFSKTSPSVRSKQAMHKIQMIQQEPRQNQQLAQLVEKYSDHATQQDEIIHNQLEGQEIKFTERLKRRALSSMRPLSQTPSDISFYLNQ